MDQSYIILLMLLIGSTAVVKQYGYAAVVLLPTLLLGVWLIRKK